MKLFQPRHTRAEGTEKNTDNPLTPVAKTAETPKAEVFEVYATPSKGYTQNISDPEPEPEVPLPEPLKPSPLWLEAIQQATVLPLAPYVVRVGNPDPETRELARLVDPGGLVAALQALALRFPQAEGVGVLYPGSMGAAFVVGDVRIDDSAIQGPPRKDGKL